jgi:putative tryptophan/tyrosine transport system substrate-binding protein
MRRRDFIAALGSASALWPLAARAQQPSMPVIGYLGTGTSSTQREWLATFTQRLHELGWREGQNLKIEVRFAEGRNERFAEIAAEFIALKVNMIVSSGGAVPAIMRTTSTIPIIFAGANDPVGSGYVTSLARPGGNVTGLSLQFADLVGKRLELLRELVPKLKHLALIGSARDSPGSVVEIDQLKASAGAQDIELATFEIDGPQDLAPAFDAFKGKTEAAYVVSNPFTTTNRVGILTLALGARLPTMFGFQEMVEAGGLISYGPDFLELWRRAADYADKVLRGTKPADIPVEQPTKFALAVNLTTAKALGLAIPGTVLARADEVIE